MRNCRRCVAGIIKCAWRRAWIRINRVLRRASNAGMVSQALLVVFLDGICTISPLGSLGKSFEMGFRVDDLMTLLHDYGLVR